MINILHALDQITRIHWCSKFHQLSLFHEKGAQLIALLTLTYPMLESALGTEDELRMSSLFTWDQGVADCKQNTKILWCRNVPNKFNLKNSTCENDLDEN